MQEKQKNFNQKFLAMLIEKARGNRSLRQFAIDCDISYMQLRKLSLCEQVNPPRKKLLQKLAQNSFGGIEYEDYLFCTGLDREETIPTPKVHGAKSRDIQTDYDKLSLRQKKTVEDFIDFLLGYKSGM